ncbi:MAG TPA: SIMPL domain-containing protein [Burkholderiales bacterium]|nr:SIMPL domain-containing protein [Burkholderiales bacterium]
MIRFLSALIVALCVQSALAHEEPVPLVRVTGQAVVMAQPDQAQIDLGVVTEAKSAASAASQNAKRLDQVLAELKIALGPKATTKTLSYSLSPNYRYPKQGGKPEITGYTAANIVQVTLENLNDSGKAIDVATQAGANAVHRLQYRLKDERAAQSQALRDAAANARAKAETFADSLSLQITKVLSVAESQAPVVIPLRKELALSETRGSATPIESGTIEVRTEVVLEVAVAPK